MKSVAFYSASMLCIFFFAGDIIAETLPVTNGLVMHLDASVIALNNGDSVGTWQDVSGNGNNATGSGSPTFVTGALNGLPVVRFNGTNNYFSFNAISTIRTVFWVLKENSAAGANDYRTLLGHSTLYDFHRGGNYTFWNSTYANPYVLNGTTKLNGAAINGTTTAVPDTYSVVSLTTTGNVNASMLGSDRNLANRYWYGDIAELVIYNRALTTAEEQDVGAYLANKYGISTEYLVPVQSGMVLHLDASMINGLSNGAAITTWNDVSGNNNNATGSGSPTFVTGALNGLPVVRFNGTNNYFSFNAISTIRTVFWVLKENSAAGANDYRTLLGHSTLYDFHRGGNYTFWNSTYANPYVLNGTTKLNGAAINGTTTAVPQTYSVVSLTTTGNVNASMLGSDRNLANRYWYGDIAELVIYNRALTTAEEQDVGAYLSQKYNISTTYKKPFDVQSGLLVHFDASAITGLNDGAVVNTWLDTSGNNNNATIGADANNKPTYKTNVINGLPVVRFGSNNSYFTFPSQTTIRTVFWVLKDSATTINRFLLGHSSAYDFHRGGFNFWDSTYANAYVLNGTTRLNGSIIDGTSTVVPQTYCIVSLITTGNVQANQLTRDRSNTAASWNGDIAEVLIYNRALSSVEEQSVGAFLSQKYGITTTYSPVVLYSGSNYTALLTGQTVEIRNTPGGALLTRWPIGTTATSTDIANALAPTSPLLVNNPTFTTEGSTTVATWDWVLSTGAIAEQKEILKFYSNYVQQQVQVCWRNSKPTYWRVNYGGRLAAGCFDLEGLWYLTKVSPDYWLPEPVPGVYTDIVTGTYVRYVNPPTTANLTLVMGGADDGDTTYWDSTVIGQTPLNNNTTSWAQIRQYNISSVTPNTTHSITVTVPNTAGNGGLWKGPYVLGPTTTLQQSDTVDGWKRALAVGNNLYNWDADTYQQPLTNRFTVSLTSVDRTAQSATRRYVPENITTGGRFQAPPYVVAIDGLNGFWGIGTLDLPRAEDGLRVEWRDGTLTCPFLLETGDPNEQGLWTNAPRIGLFVGSSKDDIMAKYRSAVGASTPPTFPSWWTGPEYCTWGDQWYTYWPHPDWVMNDANVRTWISKIDSLKWKFKLFTLDDGWWNLTVGVNSVFKNLHDKGYSILLWDQVNWVPNTDPCFQSSWGVKDAQGQVIMDGSNYIADFTQANVRNYVSNNISPLFNAYPSGRDVNGIKYDFGYISPPIWTVCSSPSWGAGEQYRARVAQYCYSLVKAKKSDGLVTWGCSNPLFGQVRDLDPINEDWFNNTQICVNRAEAILASGYWPMSTDWYPYQSYLPVQLMERPVWGVQTVMSLYYLSDSSGNAVTMSTDWTNRYQAVTYLATLATVQPTQNVTYGQNGYNVCRNSSSGSLVAGARTLVGGDGTSQCLIVVTTGHYYVASIATGQVSIPNISTVSSVYAVDHSGNRTTYSSWSQNGSTLTLNVNDSSGTTCYYDVVLQ